MKPTPQTRTPHAAEALGPLLGPLFEEITARQGGMWTLKDEASGHYEAVDPRFAAWLGLEPARVVGQSDANLFDTSLAAILRAAELTARGHDGVLASEHRFEHGGARHDFLVLRTVGESDLEGRRRVASLWIDQAAARQKETQLKTALAQLEEQQRANDQLRLEVKDQRLRDTDSGLYTRGHFEEQLRREVDLSTREHREFAIVLIDIDPPSEEVRALGAPAQARVLATLGQLLRSNTRAMDASCRFDDRLFAVLLSGVGLATAHARMEGLRRQCATQIVVLEGQELGFTVSMGVASFPHTAHSHDELMAACTSALSEAQRRGGNHVTLASIRFESG
jgi:diguanylate cyclase (GGDEF)-like protein